jgi:putative polymerase
MLAAFSGGQRSAGGGATARGEKVPMNGRAWMGSGLVLAAATFNMVLCFLNTYVLTISTTHVVAGEVVIIGLAAGVSYRVLTPQALTFGIVLLAYFCMLWLVNGAVHAKVVCDFLIPLVFISCGSAWADPRDADRLVYALILLVFSVALFEWFWLDQFLRVFDVIGYFLAKGGADASEVWSGTTLAVNGIRPDDQGRALFPVLGLHRASSIFLEPTSIGTFSAIAFAWLLVRFRIAPLRNLIFMVLVATLIVMGDSRFAAAACLVLMVVRLLPALPRMLLWLLPFVFVAALIGFAAMSSFQAADLNFQGRLVYSGQMIAGLGLGEWFGISPRSGKSALFDLDLGYTYADSGYAYAIHGLGLPGLVLLWTAFSFAPEYTLDGARYRRLVAFYLLLALCSGQSAFSIKAAALAWFLLGAARNREALVHGVSLRELAPGSSWQGLPAR